MKNKAAPKHRINFFALPSDTDSRFILLVVATLAACHYLIDISLLLIPSTIENYYVPMASCADLYKINFSNIFENAYTPDGNARYIEFTRCIQPFILSFNLIIITGLLLFTTITGIVYWSTPIFKIRRDRLTVFSNDAAPEIIEELPYYCENIGVKKPLFLWDPYNTTVSASAFGRFGKYYVVLSGGLITKFYKDKELFKSIIYHELAHIKNGDIDKTYIATATWQTFSYLILPASVLLHFIKFGFGQGFDLFVLLNMFWRVGVLTGLVFLLRNSILRSREYYADARASELLESDHPLRKSLSTLSRPNWIKSVTGFSNHPDPILRIQHLDNPNMLYRPAYWEAFGAGLIAMIAYDQTARFAIFLPPLDIFKLPFHWNSFFFTSVLLSPLIIGVVGIGIWRMTLASLSEQKDIKHGARIGLCLGFGIIIGRWLNPSQSIAGVPIGIDLIHSDYQATVIIIFNLLCILALLVFLFLYFRWLNNTTLLWLNRALERQSPKFFYIFSLTLASVIFGIWFAIILAIWNGGPARFEVDFLVTSEGVPSNDLIFYALISQPLVFLTLLGLWVIPGASQFGNKGLTEIKPTNWAFRIQKTSPVLFQRTRLSFYSSMIWGSAASLPISCLYIYQRLSLNIINEDTIGQLVGIMIILCIIIQILIGLTTAISVKSMSWFYGLSSSFTTGLATGVSLIIIETLIACVIPSHSPGQCKDGLDPVTLAKSFRDTSTIFVNSGGLCVIPLLLVITSIKKFMNRYTSSQKHG